MSNLQFLRSKIIGEKNKENIIILHGLYGSCDSFLNIAKKISTNYCVHLLNLRNHDNSFKAKNMTYDLMAEDIKNYIYKMKISKTSLIGHSMGGKTAIFVSKNYPELINKLIVIDTSPISYMNLTLYNSITNFHLNLLSILKQINLNNFKNYSEIKNKLIEKNIETNIINLILKNIAIKNKKLIWKFNLSAISNNIGNIMDGLNIDDFKERKIINETLFIKAKESEYIKNDDIKIIKYIFPNYKMVEIENSTHWMHIDNPEKLCKEILNYFVIKN